MPKIEGIDFCKKLKASGCWPLAKGNVAIISGYLTIHYMNELNELGIHYMRKPFEMKEMFEWIEDMELYQLKSFLTIADEKNLTRAAETLHLSQSALSSQIKLLEEELGVPLFSRTSRGMAITDQGRILMTHAQDVLEAAGQLQQRAVNLLHKDTNIIFHLCQSADTPQKLRHGQIDLGFFYGENQNTDIDSFIIKQVRTCVVIPNKFNQEGKDLDWPEVAELPWIWVDNNFPFFKLLQDKIQDYRTLPNQQSPLSTSRSCVNLSLPDRVSPSCATTKPALWQRMDRSRSGAMVGEKFPFVSDGWQAAREEKSIKDARESSNTCGENQQRSQMAV